VPKVPGVIRVSSYIRISSTLNTLKVKNCTLLFYNFISGQFLPEFKKSGQV
jgi:hypothetical protein